MGSRRAVRLGRGAIVSALIVGISYFFAITIPRPDNSHASQLIVRLDLRCWGFGHYCAESDTMPEGGYFYGPILVMRRYDFRQDAMRVRQEFRHVVN